MSDETSADSDAEGLDAAKETIDEEPEPGLGPGAENGDSGSDDESDGD